MVTDAQLVLERCQLLAHFSEDSSSICRRYLTPPVHDVHRTMTQWMAEVGMMAHVDAVGNIVGRRQANVAGRARMLILGSHLDTVPDAGKYDGVLGVLIALAVVARLKEDQLPFHIDVIGFSEEEGVRFSLPFIGSHAVAGSFDPCWLERQDATGLTMAEAIRHFGLDPGLIGEAAYEPETVLGYVEPHLEQGSVLEMQQCPMAIVDAIVGQSRLNLAFTGEAGHAGTVPMEQRRDALVGASKFVAFVDALGRTVEALRATVGRFTVRPNASNVIPANVECSLDIRHASDSIRREAVDKSLAYARRMAQELNLQFEILSEHHTATVRSSPRLVQMLEMAMKQRQISHTYLASGAGHDAMVMASKFPMAMLFLRHPGGISHHPDEDVRMDDVQVAIDVLVDFVRQFVLHYPANS